MKISVLGCGRWGTFIAWYLEEIGHQVTLYGRESSKNMKQLLENSGNDVIKLRKSTILETNLKTALEAEIIVISVNSQGLRGLLEEIREHSPVNKCFVLCMKGIEISTGKRLSEVVEEYFKDKCSVAVWLGPGHVEEFYHGIPNLMVIDSKDEEVKEQLVNSFSSNLIRFYYDTDLIGNEIGATAKNVIGIGAGMLDGLRLSSLKGALMATGTREVTRLIVALGGSEYSAYGLCHLGDYEATVFSEFSHNRRYGEAVIDGNEYNLLAEGYYSTEALYNIGKKHNLDLPICNAIYGILYNKDEPREVLDQLFLSSTNIHLDISE